MKNHDFYIKYNLFYNFFILCFLRITKERLFLKICCGKPTKQINFGEYIKFSLTSKLTHSIFNKLIYAIMQILRRRTWQTDRYERASARNCRYDVPPCSSRPSVDLTYVNCCGFICTRAHHRRNIS